MRIVGGAWEGGAPLPNEDELAAELGVSRTVVREAIKALQAKGLVEVRPKTGTRVRPQRAWHLLDADVVAWLFADMERADDLRELYEVRASIAAAAARLAAGAADGRAARRDRGPAAPRSRPPPPSRSPGATPTSTSTPPSSTPPTTRCSPTPARWSASPSRRRPARHPSPPDDGSVVQRVAVVDAIRAGDADGAEKAMRMLVELAWEAIARGRGPSELVIWADPAQIVSAGRGRDR